MRLHLARLSLLSLALPLVAHAQYGSSNYPYETAVSALQSAGVVDVSANVRVNDLVNRAEALKVIMKANPQYSGELAALRQTVSTIPLFPDMNQSAWYAPFIELGYNLGIVKGYPDGRVRPESNVNVAEAIVMVTRAFNEKTAQVSFSTSADLANEQSQWYTGPVSTVLARNAIRQGSRLQLNAAMTRGQLFDMVYRMRTVHTTGVSAFVSNDPIPSGGSSGGGGIPASSKQFSITIPTLGINDMTVTHPEDPFTSDGVLEPLAYGLGHLLGFPGEGAKVMVYGHSSNVPWDLSEYSKIFRTINKMNIGELIYVSHQGKVHTYQVTEKRTVAVNDATPYQTNDRGEELILYTCWPPDTIDERYLVFASPL
ncbi:MAG: sortase [Candidatus Peribacteraceae bacterium]